MADARVNAKAAGLFVREWPDEWAPIARRFPNRPRVWDGADWADQRTLERALAWPYLQANPEAFAQVLVLDYDGGPDKRGPHASQIWLDKGLPPPAWIAARAGTPKGHIAWALAAPVCKTSAARLAPLAYFARIEQAYCDAIEADRTYTGLLTKNPVHVAGAWDVSFVSPRLYTLDELAAAVDLRQTRPKRPSDEVRPVLSGRNVHAFDRARFWAYEAVRDYWHGSVEAWQRAVRAHLDAVNLELVPPLPDSELHDIARSVARWVWARFSPEKLQRKIAATHQPEQQARRGRQKGARARDEHMTDALAMLAAGASLRAVAAAVGVSFRTVGYWRDRAGGGGVQKPISDNCAFAPSPCSAPGAVGEPAGSQAGRSQASESAGF